MPHLSNVVQIHFRINQLQHELLKTKAATAGFPTITAYIRHMLFKEPFSMEKMLKEIHEEIIIKKRETLKPSHAQPKTAFSSKTPPRQSHQEQTF